MNAKQRLFRLNQALAKSGLCSRRQADILIKTGCVTVNGKVTTDFHVAINSEVDLIAVNGKRLTIPQFEYIVMYKPRGIVTTCSDEKGRAGVLELLPVELRNLRPVGRLDMDSEGLLIFTNDGDLTQRLTHPVHKMAKKYLVTVKGDISTKELKTLSSGVMLVDGRTLPAQANLVRKQNGRSIFTLVIQEGRNRQIRRMCAQLGYPVERLVRLGIGELQLGDMSPGSWRFLTSREMKLLETER